MSSNIGGSSSNVYHGNGSLPSSTNASGSFFSPLNVREVFVRLYWIFTSRYETFVLLSCIVMVPIIFLFASLLFIMVAFVVPDEKEYMNRYGNDPIATNIIDDYNRTVAPYVSKEEQEEQMQELIFQRHFKAIMALYITYMVLYINISTIARGAIIRLTADCYMEYEQEHNNNQNDSNAQPQQKKTWRDYIQQSLLQFKTLVVSHVLIALLLLVSGLLTIVFGREYIMETGNFAGFALIYLGFVTFAIYVYTCFLLSSPVVMMEPLLLPEESESFSSSSSICGRKKRIFYESFKALLRSWDLSRGKRCYIFATYAALFVVHHVLTHILHALFNSHTNNDTKDVFSFLAHFDGILITMVPFILFFPLYAILETILYFSIRVQREESFNCDVLARDIENKERNSDTSGSVALMMMAMNNNDINPFSLSYDIVLNNENSTADAMILDGSQQQLPLMEKNEQSSQQQQQQQQPPV